jgi:hypothetical protein
MPMATLRESAAKPSSDPVLLFGWTVRLVDVIARLPIGDSSIVDGMAFPMRGVHHFSVSATSGNARSWRNSARNSAELHGQQNKA